MARQSLSLRRRRQATAGVLLACFFAARHSTAAFQARTEAGPPVLRWAGDAEGGAPYVEADSADPSRVVGFDVEVAGLIARSLGRNPQFVEIAFSSIDQSIAPAMPTSG